MNYDEEDKFVEPGWAKKTLHEQRGSYNVKRRLNESRLKEVERMLAEASPDLKRDPIKFDSSGRLIDGRHRLQASANTGMGFWTKVRRYKKK